VRFSHETSAHSDGDHGQQHARDDTADRSQNVPWVGPHHGQVDGQQATSTDFDSTASFCLFS
jgi:hypothetical protein